jgi:hypothetical protein
LALFKSFGIEPCWVKITSGNVTNEFYLEENGYVTPKYQVENSRDAMNTFHWLKNETYLYQKDGKPYTMDCIFIIDGKEYKLDENGRLNIPDDAVVIR